MPLPGRVSDSIAQLNVELSPVPRVLLRGDRQFLAAIAPQLLHLNPNPPSPEGCSVKADLQTREPLGGREGCVQAERESRTPESVAQAVAPPSRPQHPTEVGPGTDGATRGGIRDFAQALFLPGGSLPFITKANVR